MIVGDGSIPWSVRGISSRQKGSENRGKLNSIIKHLDLSGSHTTSTNNNKTHTLLHKLTWSIHQTDHILGHRIHLSKFKRIDVMQTMLSDHSGIKLEINTGKIAGESPNTWGIKQHTSKKQMGQGRSLMRNKKLS